MCGFLIYTIPENIYCQIENNWTISEQTMPENIYYQNFEWFENIKDK